MIFAGILLHLKNNAKIYLWILALAAVVAGCKFFYDAGKTAATASFLDQQLDELKDAKAALELALVEKDRLQKERDGAIAKLALEERVIDNTAQEQLNDIVETQEQVIANLRRTVDGMSGDLRVHEANTETSKLAAGVLASYARDQAKLSESAIRFLVREADRGDSCAVVLGACQQLHRTRETAINEYNLKYQF